MAQHCVHFHPRSALSSVLSTGVSSTRPTSSSPPSLVPGWWPLPSEYPNYSSHSLTNTDSLPSAMCIWGYGPVGVALNTARDLGGRFLVLAIWGTKGSGGSYAALTALTNLVATPLGVLFYEIFLTDSSRGEPSRISICLHCC